MMISGGTEVNHLNSIDIRCEILQRSLNSKGNKAISEHHA